MIPNFFNTPNVPIPALFKAPEPILSTARNVPIPALFTAPALFNAPKPVAINIGSRLTDEDDNNDLPSIQSEVNYAY